MYLRMIVRNWEDSFELSLPGGKVPIHPKGLISIGYCEVYNTLEDLLKEHPNETNFVQIEEIRP